MKKLHLLCNAHLDPAWLWRWNEGLAEAISTFSVAASFCEDYDGFVFNHNEALLYEWVEEYEPELFERIKKLVASGRWHIMGGWYLQPDCVMTSGESLLSQIELGREYFREKFNVTPTTAINFDPFGHSRGLVQLLKLTGYDSYVFMRPQNISGDFIWEGYDGSQVLAHGIYGGYNTLKGNAVHKIARCIAECTNETGLCLWGIGNHGGGPSKIDLDNIQEYIRNSDTEIIHSTPENYFSELDADALKVRRTSLIPSMVGCYTSMVRIKQANRRLENKIAAAEKIMAYADWCTGTEFCGQELQKAKKALAFCQFHDILPGSGIKPVEEDSLRTLACGEEIADRLFTKAFFELCRGQRKAAAGEIPVMVFNPHPYEIEGEFEVGFMLENQNWNADEETLAQVYDEEGSRLPTQNEKPDCTFNLDWIQKVSFYAKIAPSSVTRFNCRLRTVKKSERSDVQSDSERITVKNSRMEISVNRRTGLIERYAVDGRVLTENCGILEVFRDNEDPWGMNVASFSDYEGSFKLMSAEAANSFTGYPEETIPNVRVVEDGEVRIKIQSFWEYRSNRAVVEYTIPKNGIYVDVNIIMYSNEPDKMIKYRIDAAFDGAPYGQTAFGSEQLYSNGDEAVFHKWCMLEGADRAIAVYNNGIHGGSFTENSLRISLLRTPVYAAHPIENRQIAPHDRFLDHIDMGERRFCFRISTAENLERNAQIYNETPHLLSFFPSGEGKPVKSSIRIDNPDVILSSLRKKNGKYVMTLFNSSDRECSAEIYVAPKNITIRETFGKYEIKMIGI